MVRGNISSKDRVAALSTKFAVTLPQSEEIEIRSCAITDPIPPNTIAATAIKTFPIIFLSYYCRLKEALHNPGRGKADANDEICAGIVGPSADLYEIVSRTAQSIRSKVIAAPREEYFPT
jgi:hypothetical protein